jgi:hypothetical protein
MTDTATILDFIFCPFLIGRLLSAEYATASPGEALYGVKALLIQ